MNVETSEGISRQQNIEIGRKRKKEIIRAIQQADRNLICFGTNSAAECGQNECIWREDCA